MSARVHLKEIFRFMADCMMAVGTPRKAAEQVADLLVEADKLGHRSHGLNRLERYVQDVKVGRCKPNNTMKIISETASTAWVDANNVLGATSAHYGADLAIKKAAEAGVGWVCVKAANHYGIGGYWAKKISDSGMIGMTFTNGSPLVAPTRSKKAALGTNPLAVSAPGLPSTGPFYFDIATATVALGKLEMCRRRGIKLERGWAVGPDGKETLDPELAITAGSLLPLGGTERSSGYKGFGLGALVDIFSGILAGASYGHHVPRWSPDNQEEADIGQTFVAVDHKCFAPGFEHRVSDCITYWRQMTPADPRLPVLAPGDLEKQSAAEAEKTGSLPYILPLLESCDTLAKKLKVKPLDRIKIEMQRRKGEPLSSGWAQGPDGNETKDTELALKTRCLMPLGGGELTSGYKGFGLSAMVELFCGILTGFNYGHHVRSWSHSGAKGPANLGHCFVAVNAECFAPCFGHRLADCVKHWRQMEATNPELPVLAPGDKEKKSAAETDARGYVTYVKQQIESSAALAKRLNIKPMEVTTNE